jgi:hypothetical protein
MHPSHARVRWIALVAVAGLAVGAGLALRQAGVLPTRRSTTPEVGEPSERTIGEALRQAPPVAASQTPVDSSEIKRRWVDEVRGFDVARFDPRGREMFLRFANARACTCGCGYTLAGCRSTDMTCEVSGAALTALGDSILAGRITTARGIRSRPSDGR